MKEINHERHGKTLVTDHVYNLIEKNKREWCPQRTQEWFEKRNNHITASVMAGICKANPYESRLGMLKKKVGEGPKFVTNAACDWGNKHEDIAIHKYEKKMNEKVIEFGLLESMNPNEEYLAGSPDGITASGKLIEVKCPFRRVPTEVVPIYYVYQVQFLMHTLRISTCDFIQFVPENAWQNEVMIITKIDYDPVFWKTKVHYMESFWASVLEVRAKKLKNKNFLVDKTDLHDHDDEEKDEDEDTLCDEHTIYINIPNPNESELRKKRLEKALAEGQRKAKRRKKIKDDPSICLF